MKPMGSILVLAAVVPLSAVSVQAQIRNLTVRTPRNPVPPMPLLQPSAAPASASSSPVTVAAPSVPAKVVVPPPALQGPAFDKSEVDKRVLAFQNKRAREGSASAQYDLGVRYLTGHGVAQDAAQARYWLEMAARGGSVEARRKLQELEAASK